MITKDEFRAEATAFLETIAKPKVKASQEWGQGSDEVGLLPERTPEEDARMLAEAKEYRARIFDAGFGWITGPEAYGGRNLPREYERIWQGVEASYDVPGIGPFGIGLGMVAPTILAHGIEEVRQRYLKPLYRGDIVACQLFSEPAAGSDLAGIQTKSVRDGDEWVLNGQKVWTSGAQYSDIGEIITRTSTDPDSRHRGMTMFLVDMKAPGVEIRPLRQITGGASFNEVFFTDVRVPDDHRLGEVGEGWTVALTTLMNERMAIGGGATGGGMDLAGRLKALARYMGVAEDPNIRQQLADVLIRHSVNRYTTLRAMAKMRAGQAPGPEMSTLKMGLTDNMQRISALVTSLLGPRLVADVDEWGTYAWGDFVLSVPGLRVAGGTDEVLRNIVGERVLGLPKG